MYKIGDFSKITQLTVKALRYYDQEEILKPSYRNEENGYRFYDDNDFKKARLILLLRKLQFSVAEIKDVVAGYENSSDLPYFLEEKKKIIEARIEEEKLLLKSIDLYINYDQEGDDHIEYIVSKQNIDDALIASIRYTGKYNDVGKYIGKLYSAVKGNVNGYPFSCYYDSEYREEADIELCLPTSKKINHEYIRVRELPAITALCTTHVGPYENLSMAYKAILDYAREHNLKCSVPSREIYVKGPGRIFKGNPNKYITKLVVPIEREDIHGKEN